MNKLLSNPENVVCYMNKRQKKKKIMFQRYSRCTEHKHTHQQTKKSETIKGKKIKSHWTHIEYDSRRFRMFHWYMCLCMHVFCVYAPILQCCVFVLPVCVCVCDVCINDAWFALLMRQIFVTISSLSRITSTNRWSHILFCCARF